MKTRIYLVLVIFSSSFNYFKAFSQNSDRFSIVSVLLYEKGTMTDFVVYQFAPSDTIFIDRHKTDDSVVYRTTVLKGDLENIGKMMNYLNKRKGLTLLFRNQGKILNWDYHQSYPLEGSIDNSYFYVVINRDKSTRQVQLITDNYKMTKFKYVWVNWPWKIISSYRLYYKCLRGIQELYDVQSDLKWRLRVDGTD